MSPKTPYGAMHALAANMTQKPRDLILHEADKGLEIIAAHEDNQRRLVGKEGQNIKALKHVAAWLGYRSLTLAEPDERVAGLGERPEQPPAGANLREPQAARAFFRNIVLDLFQAAGCAAGADVGTDEPSAEIFISVDPEPSANNRPEVLTVAAIGKILRAIAVRHGWEEIDFQCT